MTRKILLLCVALLMLTVTLANAAAGVALRWSQCLGDGGTLNRSSACAVNTGACAGCDVPVCLVFETLQVIQGTVNGPRMSGPINAGSDSHDATWQGGATATSFIGDGCPRAKPVRNSTWGAVKSLYR